MFALNEKVVYPGYGVAKVNRVVNKCIGGQESVFFELTFLHKEATVLVPTHNLEAAGIRPLSSGDNVKDAFRVLTEPARKITPYEFTASNWNKRNKEYQLKLRRGSLRDLSEVYRDLRYISSQKELSFGEKNLLNQTESLLVEEISLIQKRAHEKTVEELRTLSAR